VFWLFFKIDLCSAISFGRSRRGLSIDVAEHSFVLNNHQNTTHVLVSYPKQIQHSLKRVFCFTVLSGSMPPEVIEKHLFQ